MGSNQVPDHLDCTNHIACASVAKTKVHIRYSNISSALLISVMPNAKIELGLFETLQVPGASATVESQTLMRFSNSKAQINLAVLPLFIKKSFLYSVEKHSYPTLTNKSYTWTSYNQLVREPQSHLFIHCRLHMHWSNWSHLWSRSRGSNKNTLMIGWQ
jgi:hypothetical protein